MPRPRIAGGAFERAPFAGRRDLACTGLTGLDKADPFFPDHHGDDHDREAKRMCRRCPVRWNCLDWALDVREFAHGVWGGYNPAERRKIADLRGIRVTPPADDEVGPPRNLDRIVAAFAAARTMLDGKAQRQDLIGAVTAHALDCAVYVLRYGPALEVDVLDGGMSLKAAAALARTRRVAA